MQTTLGKKEKSHIYLIFAACSFVCFFFFLILLYKAKSKCSLFKELDFLIDGEVEG